MTDNAPSTFDQFFDERFGEQFLVERALEQQRTEEAFAGLTHTVCGLELRGMTPYDMLILQGMGNPFIAGGVVEFEDVAKFCAVLAEPPPAGFFSGRKFFKTLTKIPLRDAAIEIERFLDRMFAHSGIKRTDGVGGGSSANIPVDLCFIAPLVIGIATKTGWSKESIMGTRLDQLFQFQRAISLSEGGKPTYPASDRLISDALAAYDEYLKTLKS